jgi:hypothetical protein
MRSQIWLHVRIHLKFLARSRVLAGVAALVVLGTSVGIVPALFYTTNANRFDILQNIAQELHWVAAVVTGGIGLLIVWSHRRQRSIKMIATKPTPLEGWALSVFVAAALASVAAHVLVAIAVFGLSWYWSVPYEIGFAYLAATQLFHSLILQAVLTALGTAVHPVICALFVVFFSESTFRGLGTIVAGALEAGRQSFALTALLKVLRGLYWLAPTYAPLADRTEWLEKSMRAPAGAWRLLLAAAGYTLLASAFGYLLTLTVLRRRSLI